MNTSESPDPITKLTQMGDVTLYEPAGDQPLAERPTRRAGYQSHSLAECISNVSTPTGAKPVLKTMLTTACERNCCYCPFRAGRSQTKRVTISPDDMAKAFDSLRRAGQVDGLFLSSGIVRGGVTTQDKLIDTADILRTRYHYKGYIHLKMMPGAEYDQLYRAMQLADRVSVNMEGATQARLEQLAPKKDWQAELLQLLTWTQRIREQHRGEKLARAVTQFVVGAVGDTDLELLALSERLYGQLRLARVYYSAFSPVENTPFEHLPTVNPLREHRLYQASFLLRDYGWSVEDMPFQQDGNMRLDVDPKRAWADEHLRLHPVDLQTAEREALMRVPGIGKVGAETILKARKRSVLRDVAALRRLGIRAPEQAIPFILLNGRRVPDQLSLF